MRRRSWPASCSRSTSSGADAKATRLRPTATGSASSRRASPTPRRRISAEAIDLVKADMEAPRPMDRLICGDVGYGKTEVALRAAFKGVADGKQVLMLVPTTILAQQHYGTFRERLADYPITVDHVSRFRSAAEQREAIGDSAKAAWTFSSALTACSRATSRQGPRPAGPRRGAALRRAPEGAAAPAAPARRRDRDVGDADSAHAADVARRAARHLGDRDAAGRPPPGSHLRRRVRRAARAPGARARARARRPGVLSAQPRRDDRRGRRRLARPRARSCGSRSRTASWTNRSSRRG